MQSISASLSERNTEIIVISADQVADNQRLAARKGFDFRLLADPELSVIDQFGLRHSGGGFMGNDIARPAVFIADKTGQITWKEFTANWRVRVRPEQILEQTKSFE